MSVHVLGVGGGPKCPYGRGKWSPCEQINRQTDMTENITLTQTTYMWAVNQTWTSYQCHALLVLSNCTKLDIGDGIRETSNVDRLLTYQGFTTQ